MGKASVLQGASRMVFVVDHYGIMIKVLEDATQDDG